MLKALYHKNFKKDFRKIQRNVKERFAERFLMFLENPAEPILRDHPLVGDLSGKLAFSIAGDVRVIYRFIDKKLILLLRIGTHNQVY
ncbi:type II toxin-antitoxin system mRNA interferase toxin, RelE/StbE family [Candidatus Peregrinibacteria bacterium]|nr:type II toxin-antitoxin system mRNA interferase toxin, RelE/StbE family [Candidatus Peregrinibacteria bacterium]